uniref:EMG1 N1-specific pseudouridine methyltransferase n=1 Tax=Fundulus heteroclitus TaxID=8078 RepID=A0A3Q2PIB1_FUNHE
MNPGSFSGYTRLIFTALTLTNVSAQINVNQVHIHSQMNVNQITLNLSCVFMENLLHKLSVRAADGPQKLLKMIKNPVSDHLPPGCPRIATSFSAGEAVNARTVVPEGPAAVVIGAFAHGSVKVDYTEQTVSISNYPLSAALTCAKMCSAFEEVWGVL